MISNTDNSCYTTRYIENNSFIFPESLMSTTYVITMENSNRLNKCLEELRRIPLTKWICVFTNKGWKKCEKDTYINSTIKDLWYTNIEICKREKSTNKYIAILEDDSRFVSSAYNLIKTHVVPFIQNKSPEVYSLGIFPLVTIPNITFSPHIRVISGTMAHAMIYSPLARNKMIKNMHSEHITNDIPHDLFTTNHLFKDKWSHFKNIAYQKHEQTENSKIWDKYGILTKLFTILPEDKFYKVNHLVANVGGIYTILFIIIIIFIFLW